jgi:hypothetical protein
MVRKPNEYSPYTYYLRKARTRGKGLTDLDLKYLKGLWEEQNGQCAFTGLPLRLRNEKQKNDNIFTASLDRIDSSVGYVKGNVQYVSVALNLAKKDLSDEHFRDRLQSLFEAYSKKDGRFVR